MPELAPDEVLVAVMASSINYNTVWSAMFEPSRPSTSCAASASQGGCAARHDLPPPRGRLGRAPAWSCGSAPAYGAGRSATTSWSARPTSTTRSRRSHADGMLGAEQRAWGFETNFGGLAHYAVVRASQLVPKPAHLTWEEAASHHPVRGHRLPDAGQRRAARGSSRATSC